MLVQRLYCHSLFAHVTVCVERALLEKSKTIHRVIHAAKYDLIGVEGKNLGNRESAHHPPLGRIGRYSKQGQTVAPN